MDAVSIDDLKTDYSDGEGKFADRLCDLIEIGDRERIKERLDNLKEMYKSKVMRETEIKVQVTHNIVLLHGMLEKKYPDRITDYHDFDLITDQIKKSDSLEDLIHRVCTYAIELSEKIGISTTDNIVKRVLAYMERNYIQDLKLEDIAKIFCYNSAYLGKVFKKVTGDSFNNVLNNIRINNAKRLLLKLT